MSKEAIKVKGSDIALGVKEEVQNDLFGRRIKELIMRCRYELEQRVRRGICVD